MVPPSGILVSQRLLRKTAEVCVLVCALMTWTAWFHPAELCAEQTRPAAAAPDTTGGAGVVPVPQNVRAEGLPPVPASLPDALLPYGSSRRALMLAWHPTRRELLIWT